MELIAEFDTRGKKMTTVDVIRECVRTLPCSEHRNEIKGFIHNDKSYSINLLQVKKASRNVFCLYKNDYIGEC